MSESVDYYVSNPESGVILSYLNDKIKIVVIVVIQKSALYTDGHLVVILSACALPENGLRERLSHYNKQYLKSGIAFQARYLSFDPQYF